MTYFLGIDIGTSSVKAVLVDADSGDLVASAGQEYPLHMPRAGYAEQDPDDWWAAAVDTVRRVLVDTSGADDVAGIGFSGQMHGTLLLDASGKPLHPAIIWADQRSAPACDVLLEAVGEAEYVRITGTRPAAGFMAATLVWMKQHQPELLSQTAAVVLPKDYVRLRMTGNIHTDVSDAAGTGLFDIRRQEWAQTVINAVDLPPHIFPAVKASYEITGTLTAQAAETLGLRAGIPVAAGCADQPAQAVGNGILRPGIASVTVGSGGQVFVPVLPDASDALKTDPRLHIFNHAVPGWYALGAILSAGLSLRWLRDLVGLNGQPDAYAILSSEAAQVPAGADGLIFLPYLSGERTPHFDPCARGSFIGLAAHHRRGHLARAVMEGVTFSLKQALELCEQIGQPAEQIIVSGGGVESPVWRQMMADILGRPVLKSIQTEQASIGAAMLAAIGTGYYGDSLEANIEAVRQRSARYTAPTQPAAADAQIYAERYAQFISLYPTLKSDFQRLAGCDPL